MPSESLHCHLLKKIKLAKHSLRAETYCLLYVEILGGGFPLGSLVMVMEDPEAPHHMLLLRNFMSQGLVHGQPLLYASPSKDPRGFLGTLPSPALSKEDKSRERDLDQVHFIFSSSCLSFASYLICQHG